MTVSCGQHTSEAYIEWCDETIAKLEQLPHGAARRRRGLEPEQTIEHLEAKRMNANPTGAALLLDGRRDDDPTLALAHDALVDGLAAGGWAVDDWRLRDDKIAWCAGCFKCWTHDAGRVRAPRRRAQGGRALGAQRPRRLPHAGDVRRLLVGAQEGARPRDPDPAAVHAEAARRDAPPAALRAPARPARGRHRPRRPGRRPGGARRSGGWSSATRSTCSRRAGRSACSRAAPATGRCGWPSTALLAKVGVKPARDAVGAGRERGGRMKAPQKALLLVGSPKPGESTSESLGGYCSRSWRSAAWRRRRCA